MKTDLSRYKNKIRDYIQAKNIHIDDNQHPPLFPCPEHDDNHPSCILYEDNSYCPVCSKNFDIFELAGIYAGVSKFPEKIKEVESTLNITINDNYSHTHTPGSTQSSPNTPAKKRKKQSNYIAVTKEQAAKLYTKPYLLNIAKKAGWGDKITGCWAYKNKSGLVELVDVRFEGGAKSKAVISFYYNGKYVTSKNPPILLYGKEKIKDNGPYLIVEGSKCAKIVEDNLKHFIDITWNGGSGKASMVDWSPLEGKNVYMLPDDDKPGLKAAFIIKKYLPQLKIVKPLAFARAIKKEGADIEEALQVLSTQDLIKYIENPDNHVQPPPEPPPADTENNDIEKLPFKALGVADDGKAYFIDREGRLFDSKLESLSQGKLIKLAPLEFWKAYFEHDYKMTRDSWTEAMDWVVKIAGEKDFDVEDIRGRGAWRENGDIIYHDGQTTYGKTKGDKLYLRKKKKDIGIKDEPILKNDITKIKNAIMALSFETPADAIRCIAWSTLSPFGGALPWRPAFLLTGESGSGKTTAADYVIRKIASPVWLRGDETTPAGVRGGLQKDSCCVVFEESDDDTEKKRQAREALFSMMRASTSDDAPDIWKGTSDQGKNSYSSKNMFGFIAVSTQVESQADLNRLCWINMKIATGGRDKWRKIKKEIIEVMSEKNCRAIRARTWRKLSTILTLAEDVADYIQELTGMDNRYSLLEGILFSAYLVVWRGIEQVDEKAKTILQEYIKVQPPEKLENDTVNIIERLLDESVQMPGGKYTQKIELREIITAIHSGKIKSYNDTDFDGQKELSKSELMEYKRTAGLYGLAVNDSLLAIRCNHHTIMKIIGKGRGYHRQLKRHPDYKGSKNVSISGTTHSCVLIGGIIDDIPF